MALRSTIEAELSKENIIDKKIAELWEAHSGLKHPSPGCRKAIGVSESFELSTACPDFIDFIVAADDRIMAKEELEKLDYLLDKFTLPQKKGMEITDEEKKELEIMYRKYLEKKYGDES